jgi:branched-chain amino acid transport system substrate-binding protein
MRRNIWLLSIGIVLALFFAACQPISEVATEAPPAPTEAGAEPAAQASPTQAEAAPTEEATAEEAATEEAAAAPAELPGVENGNILIGVVGIMTGDNAQNGEFVRNGAQLAIDEINAAGGVTPAGMDQSFPIELRVADDQATPDVGLNAITKLVEEDKVFAFMGPDYSGITFPSLSVAADAGVPQITSSIAAKITQQGYETIFRGRSNDATWMAALIDYLVETEGVENIALAYTNIELGQSGVEFAQQYMQDQYGLEPTIVVSHEFGDRDLSPNATQIMQTNPDAVIDWGTQIEASLLVRELRDLGFEGPFGYNAADEIFTDLAQENSIGVIGPQNWVYTKDDEKSQAFTQAYIDNYGNPPSPHSVVYYDAVYLYKQAIEEVGLDRQAVLDYLHGLDNYDAVQGTFRPAELEGGEMTTATVIIAYEDESLEPTVVRQFE